jgi:hypothetical protein
MKRPALLILLLTVTSLAAWSQNSVPGNAVSSSKHYRESGVGNATGRGGSVLMTTRALLGKDGNTTVEVTTGTLDSSITPPGSFAKVQFKPLNAVGDPLFTQNFTPLSTAGGYYTFTWPSLHRAEQIQLQGNINGIDKNRTDVVTVVETTKLRPDLGVENLSFPSSALVNRVVNISASIVELNGDASATTTCMLAIDGANVDQANNVYVDAGGRVSCAFVHTFTTTGSHNIQVTETNVVPGDWDTSNNSASGVITITNPGTAEHAWASFGDSNGTFSQSSDSYEIWYLGNVLENYSNTYGTSGRTQGSDALFVSGGCAGGTAAAAWQFPVNLTYTESIDGTSEYSVTDQISGYSTSSPPTSFPFCNSTVATVAFQYGADYANDHWQHLSSEQFFDSAANLIWSEQTLEISRYAGDVTYFSYGYQCFWWKSPSATCNNPSDYYAWNSSQQNVYGTLIPVGSTWVPTVVTQDATGNTFSGSISVPLNSQHNSNQSNNCYNYGPDNSGYTYQNCSLSGHDFTFTQGSANN